MTVIQNAGYEISPEFNLEFNRGRTIAHLGFENERYDEMEAILKTIQFEFYSTYISNKTINGEIVRWVDVEGYIAQSRSYPELIQTAIDASDIWYGDGSSATNDVIRPIVIDIFDMPRYDASDIIHVNTIFPANTTGLSTPYRVHGMFQPVTVDGLTRYISLNVSKGTPVIDNVMEVEQLEPRTAAAFYLTPYKTAGGLTAFVCGNTGKEVIDKLLSTSIVNDIVPVYVVTYLLHSSKQRQYDIARLVNVHRRLYGSVSNVVFGAYVAYTYRYQPVLTLLDRQPNASNEELDAAFDLITP